MTVRWRVVLAVLGLAVCCVAAAAAAYRWWPLGVTSDEFRPAPTLFAPPEAEARAGERL